MSPFAKDLVILVSDKNMQFGIEALLKRHKDLGIRQITAVVRVHPERDPGCCGRSQAFLQGSIKDFAHALVMFDRHGCGQEGRSRETIEKTVTSRLDQSGWKDRARAIVIDPELEQWVWSDSPVVPDCLGQACELSALKARLQRQRLWPDDQPKPPQPKELVERCLEEAGKRRSSVIYKRLAEGIDFRGCEDPSFLKFRDTLREWFPAMRE